MPSVNKQEVCPDQGFICNTHLTSKRCESVPNESTICTFQTKSEIKGPSYCHSPKGADRVSQLSSASDSSADIPVKAFANNSKLHQWIVNS